MRIFKDKLFLELRYRLQLITYSILLIFFILFVYRIEVIQILVFYQKEDIGDGLSVQGLGGVLWVYLKLCFFLSLYFNFPVFIFQLTIFFIPSFYKSQKKKVIFYLFKFLCTYIFCAYISYHFFIPYLWNFCYHFQLVPENYESENKVEIVGVESDIDFAYFFSFYMISLILFQVLIHFYLNIILYLSNQTPFLLLDYKEYDRKFIYYLCLLLCTLLSIIIFNNIFFILFLTFIFILFYETHVFCYLLKKEYGKTHRLKGK